MEWFNQAFVYVGSWDEKLYCLNAVTGALVWAYNCGNWIYSLPAVAGGCVYFGNANNVIFCVNATTGAFIWSHSTGNTIYYSSPAVVGGLMYIGSFDHKLYCLNGTTGTLVWNYTTGNSINASPTVIGGYVYIGSYDDNLYCLNAITGAKIWNYVTEGALFGSPAVVGSYVYVGDFDNITYCLNAFTGVQVWNYTTDNALWSSPAVAGNYLYIGSQGGYLYCLNAFTGVFIWKYNTGDQMWRSPTVVGGHLYVGNYFDTIYCLKTLTPMPPVLNSITPNPNTTGSITISWNPVTGATSYNLYQYTSLITNINNSVILAGNTGSTSMVKTLSIGIYYFVVTAVNSSGESSISNCQEVNVVISSGSSLTTINLAPGSSQVNFVENNFTLVTFNITTTANVQINLTYSTTNPGGIPLSNAFGFYQFSTNNSQAIDFPISINIFYNATELTANGLSAKNITFWYLMPQTIHGNNYHLR